MFKSVRSHSALKPSAEVQMTPLIDMVFILLIFFIVTTHFVSDIGLQVERPASRTASPLPTQTLRLAIHASGTLTIEGRPVTLAGLRAWLKRQHPAQIQKTLVIVAHRDTPADRIVAVMDEARGAGIEKVALATQAEENGS